MQPHCRAFMRRRLMLAVALAAVGVATADHGTAGSANAGYKQHHRRYLSFGNMLRRLENEAQLGKELGRELRRGFVRENPLVAVGDVLSSAGDAIDSAVNEVDHASEESYRSSHLGLMDGIEVFRCELCLDRPQLPQHKKCVDFMTERCAKETSGKGYCGRFWEIMNSACNQGEEYCCESVRKISHAHGKGDSADSGAVKDADGDGHEVPHDAFPSDPTEWEDTDGDGIGDNADEDDDNDGVPDAEDGYPKDASRSDLAAAGEAAPLDTDADADASADVPDVAQANFVTETNIDKKERPLPPQGYNEYVPSVDEYPEGPGVEHDNWKTQLGDWRSEWPSLPHESEMDTWKRICDDNQNLRYCEMWLRNIYGRGWGSGPKRSRSDSGTEPARAEVREASPTGPKRGIGWFNDLITGGNAGGS